MPVIPVRDGGRGGSGPAGSLLVERVPGADVGGEDTSRRRVSQWRSTSHIIGLRAQLHTGRGPGRQPDTLNGTVRSPMPAGDSPQDLALRLQQLQAEIDALSTQAAQLGADETAAAGALVPGSGKAAARHARDQLIGQRAQALKLQQAIERRVSEMRDLQQKQHLDAGDGDRERRRAGGCAGSAGRGITGR